MHHWTPLASSALLIVSLSAAAQPAPAPTGPGSNAPPPAAPSAPPAPDAPEPSAPKPETDEGTEAQPARPNQLPPASEPANAPPGPYYEESAPPPAQPPSEPVHYEGTSGVVEPPPPRRLPPLEPPPPPEPGAKLAPRTAFLAGVRAEYFIPTGSVWADGRSFSDPAVCCRYFNQGWRDFTGSGLALEADAGARLARRYTVFAFWQHAFLADGDESPAALSEQTSASSDFWGLGVRFSTQPSSLGFLVELGLGYRVFRAEWDGRETLAGADEDEDDPLGRVPNTGGKLELKDDFISSRIGVGADIRFTPNFSLSPMVFLNGGTFGAIDFETNEGELVDPVDGNETGGAAFERLRASYAVITFSLGGHFDIY